MGDGVDKAFVAGGLALASKIPVVGVATSIARALVPNGDADWMQALEDDYRDASLRLEAKVNVIEERLNEQGKTLEQLGAVRTKNLLQDFAAAFDETNGEEKREALLNVTAKQFDSTWLDATKRRFWFDTIAKLNDYQIFALRILSEHDLVFVSEQGDVLYHGPERQQLEEDIERAGMLSQVLATMPMWLVGSLSSRRLTLGGRTVSAQEYRLLQGGKGAVRALQAPERVQPGSGVADKGDP